MTTRGRVPLARLAVGLAAASVLALVVAYAIAPALRPHLLLEDHALEQATALLFLAAAIVGVWRYRRSMPRIYLLVPACALVGALDEIGFGSRWLGRDVPRLRQIEIDGAHDAFMVLYDVLETREPLYLAVYAGAALALFGASVWFASDAARMRRATRAGVRFARAHPPLAYLAVAAALVLPALVLDLDLVEAPWLFLIEELLEFECALMLFFAALALGRD